jgi:CBS domain-containing protein
LGVRRSNAPEDHSSKSVEPPLRPGLDLALERMGANQIEILPVVSRADVHKLEGIVTLHDVLDAYGVSTRDRA